MSEREWARIWGCDERSARPPDEPADICRPYRVPAILLPGVNRSRLFSTGMAAEVSVLYAEGHYHSEPYAGAARGCTLFHWAFGRNLPIPFLEGRAAPTNRKYYLVFCRIRGLQKQRVYFRRENPTGSQCCTRSLESDPSMRGRPPKGMPKFANDSGCPQEQVINAEASGRHRGMEKLRSSTSGECPSRRMFTIYAVEASLIVWPSRFGACASAIPRCYTTAPSVTIS